MVLVYGRKGEKVMKTKLLKLVKFTRASQKDKEITLSVNEIAKNLSPKLAIKFRLAASDYSNQFIIDVRGIPTKFLVGRKGRTLYSHCVHPEINTPDVGLPNFFVVDTIRVERI